MCIMIASCGDLLNINASSIRIIILIGVTIYIYEIILKKEKFENRTLLIEAV